MAFFGNKRKDFSIQPPRQQVDGTPFFVTDSANIDFTLENLNLTANLTPTGVTAGTYGSSTRIPILQVDQWGRITGVTTTTFSASGITLETNGTPNTVQTLLNLVAGTNMTITDDGLGNITFDAAGGGGGSGTVTSVGTGTGLTGGPITNTGTISLNSKLAPADTLVGNALKFLRVNAGETAVEYADVANGGGGGGRSYYLNGSVIQGTFGGIVDMRQMSPVPVIGAGTDFTINTNGYIKSFITDAGDPNKAVIPAGNWNFELWFSANSNGGSPSFYVELSKYDTVGGTFTPIATSSATPEGITNGTAIDLYFTALSVPQTTLALTDRLAVRIFVNNSSRTITLHTQGPHLSQIITDFPSGINSLNGLTAFVQNFATPGTSGTAPNWSSVLDAHTLNIPLASVASVTGGLISKTEYDTFNGKQDALTTTKSVKISTNNVELDGDETSPSANKYYGTDGTGNRGYHILNQVPVPYIYTRKVYQLIGTYLTSMVYHPSLLFFSSFFVGGGSGGTQIYDATTAEFDSTSTFTQALYNRKVTNGVTDEVWIISQNQPSIQRLNASTGDFIANSLLTGVIATAINTRFCQFNSLKVFLANATNYFVLNPATFVTTSFTAHGLGNIPHVAVNNNPASPQNGTIMMGGPNGIILIDGTTNAITVPATTLSGAIGPIYDIQYDSTNDVWIVLTASGVTNNPMKIVYIKPNTATTFTVPTTVYGISLMGSAFAAGGAIYARLLIDEVSDYLFLFSNHRLTQLRLTTGDIIQSLPIQSASPAVTTNVFSAADIDIVNKRLFASSGLNSGISQWTVNEIMYS